MEQRQESKHEKYMQQLLQTPKFLKLPGSRPEQPRSTQVISVLRKSQIRGSRSLQKSQITSTASKEKYISTLLPSISSYKSRSNSRSPHRMELNYKTPFFLKQDYDKELSRKQEHVSPQRQYIESAPNQVLQKLQNKYVQKVHIPLKSDLSVTSLFKVEITDQQLFQIRASSKQRSFEINIRGPDNLRLLKSQFGNDYPKMCSSLRIQGDQLLLIKPN